jgi:transposase
MNEGTTVLGLDVHKETIAAALLDAGAEAPRDWGQVPNTPEAVRKLVRRAQGHGAVVAVYEAGPCGFTTHRHLTELGVRCVVIAPSLIPMRPGDRVKTDRRDAAKLARLFRAGELTEVRVPSADQEAARDLVRIREDVLENRLRARHRISKFLLRLGRIWRESKPWGAVHTAWLRGQRFDEPAWQQTHDAYLRTLAESDEHLRVLTQQVDEVASWPAYRDVVAALRCLKGVDTLGAVTLAAEIQDFHRFAVAPAFMAYTGLVGRERSSGERTRRGGITKAGNAHVRRVLVEAAWSYRHPKNIVGPALAARRAAVSPELVRVAQRAQDRLTRTFWRLVSRNKPPQVAVVAVARELAGFVWALARQAVPEAKA